MKFIETKAAPIPAGHYSQAVVANGFVFLAGQLPIVPGSTLEMPEGVAEQTRQVFKNLDAILKASGSGLSDLVSVQIFISDLQLWGQFNVVYQEMLGSHKPARTVVPCNALHYGALVEVNAVAVARG